MVRRRLLPAAALVMSVGMLLTACGDGEESKDSDGIAGADQGDRPTASTGAPQGSSAKGPDVTLPKDLKLVFDWDAPSDAEQAAALGDAAKYVQSIMHGIVKQDVNDKAYRFYSVGGAKRYAQQQIKASVDGGWTATGTDRYYEPEVEAAASGSKSMLVSFCNNQAKVYSKSVKSGKVNRTEESIKSYSKYRIYMTKSSGPEGVWRAQQTEVQGEADECRQE